MDAECVWNCLFILDNGAIRIGIISQEIGLELAEHIKALQKRNDCEGQRICVTISNVLDGEEFNVVDILFYQAWRQPA